MSRRTDQFGAARTPLSAPLTMSSTAVLIAALAAPAMPAFAQGATTLEEVIVTARKRQETMQDTPLSITAMLGDELERRGITEFAQLSYNNPNVKILPGATGAGISTTVAIRGNVQNDSTFQIDPAVGTYIDGFIVARTFGVTGSMIDMESVQTLKGPQGTLFGRNTTGGAVLIATRNPDTSGLSGFVTGEVGEIGTQALTGAINIPFTDNIALRVAAQHSERDGFVELTDGQELGDTESATVRAKLLWNVTDATSLLLSAERVDIHGTAAINRATQPNDAQYHNVPATNLVPVAPGFSLPVPLVGSDEKNSVDVETFNFTLSHELDWGEVKLLAGSRDTDVKINQSLPPALGFTKQDKPDNEQKSVELQLNGSFFNDLVDITSGIYWFDEKTFEDQLTNPYPELIALGFPPLLAAAFMETNVESQSAYVQSTYHWTDNTGLTAGLRYTDDTRESDGSYATAAAPFPALTYESDEKEFNYLVSIDHSFSPDLLVYANTSTGYRSGGANLSPANATQWNAFAPESLTNYEIGMKSDWLDGRLRVNGALFYQDYEDYQYTSIRREGQTQVRESRTSDAVIQGGELEVTVLLPADFQVDLSYGYVDGEETEGNQLPNIPRNTVGLAVTKAVELGFGALDLTANYDWRDKFYTSIGSKDASTVENRGVLNLSAALTTGPWQVIGYVNNVTDEEYYQHLTYAAPGNGGLQGISMASLGIPRIAGAKVTYNF